MCELGQYCSPTNRLQQENKFPPVESRPRTSGIVWFYFLDTVQLENNSDRCPHSSTVLMSRIVRINMLWWKGVLFVIMDVEKVTLWFFPLFSRLATNERTNYLFHETLFISNNLQANGQVVMSLWSTDSYAPKIVLKTLFLRSIFLKGSVKWKLWILMRNCCGSLYS